MGVGGGGGAGFQGPTWASRDGRGSGLLGPDPGLQGLNRTMDQPHINPLAHEAKTLSITALDKLNFTKIYAMCCFPCYVFGDIRRFICITRV